MSQLSQDSLLLVRSGLGEGLQKGFQPQTGSEDFHLIILTWSGHCPVRNTSGRRRVCEGHFPIGWLMGATQSQPPMGPPPRSGPAICKISPTFLRGHQAVVWHLHWERPFAISRGPDETELKKLVQAGMSVIKKPAHWLCPVSLHVSVCPGRTFHGRH